MGWRSTWSLSPSPRRICLMISVASAFRSPPSMPSSIRTCTRLLRLRDCACPRARRCARAQGGGGVLHKGRPDSPGRTSSNASAICLAMAVSYGYRCPAARLNAGQLRAPDCRGRLWLITAANVRTANKSSRRNRRNRMASSSFAGLSAFLWQSPHCLNPLRQTGCEALGFCKRD
jgi:hypothetical protein